MSVVLYEKKDHLVHITLNRPEAMNALSREVCGTLLASWEAFRDDDDAWVVIVSGAGDRCFSAGADLKEMASAAPASVSAVWQGRNDFQGVSGIPLWKPAIAAIQGFCVAGGLELALACDIRVCAEDSSFGLSEVTRGIIPGGGGTQRLPRLMPYCIAMEMLLTGKRISAQEALRYGLVNRVVPVGQHMAAAEEMAHTILNNAPLAVRAIKEAVSFGLDMSLNEGLRLESTLLRTVQASEDAREGPLAFAEKRKPVYKGR